ncbi:MAG: bifunctional precorrin-2 dehydrogenase/sirohydrochlorin ferrochelatase [Methanomassiliicoccales archaeon]
MPLLLDVRGKRVVVFGGGEVGLRKASFFCREADVMVVSRAFIPGFGSISKDIDKITCEIGPEQEGLIDEADFVIIATGDHELNDRLEARAKMSGKYCNRADGLGSFLIPSVVERRNFIVAISTLGRSPAMARFLKGSVEEKLGPEMSSMIELQEELRDKARSIIPDQAARERFLWDILGDESIWAALDTDPTQARLIALRRLGVDHANDI